MRLALALLISFAATPAFANALTFIGMLDGRDIQVELTEPVHGAVAGRYAYNDDGADIPLRPVSVAGNVWTLAEEAPCAPGACISGDDGLVVDPPIAAIWEITYDADAYIGTATRTPATGAKAKPVSFELMVMAWRKFADQPTAFDLHDRAARLSYDENLPLDWGHAPYEMQLLDVALDGGEVTESNGIAWQYVTEPRSGLTFPRLVAPADDLQDFGFALDAHFYRMSLAALDCKAFRYGSYGVNEYMLGLGGHTAGYEDEQVTLSYLSPTLASWSQSGSLYCQGAHPYNHLDNYTFDVRTGAPIDWRKVFSAIVPRPWFSPPEDVADLETALADPDSYDWGPSVDFIAFIQQRRASYDDAELEELCATDQSIAEQLRMRVIGEAEIMFTLSGFPHVSSVCNADIFSATLEELEPFLAETAKDYFPVLAR
jgi:hypothetical protein